MGVGLLAYAFSSGPAPGKPDTGLQRYDAELGWVNAAKLAAPELPAQSRWRVVFSGDGATLGVGVRDDESFPAAIERLEPRIGSVNLAVADYGVDQAFLRILRDGLPLEPALVVLAFGARGLRRMEVDRSVAAKPRLALHGESLDLANQPVPSGEPSAATRIRARVLGWLGFPADPGLDETAAAANPLLGFAPIAERVFAELAALGARERRALLLVYLPAAAELDGPAQPARAWASSAAARLKIAFLDATPALSRGDARRVVGRDGSYTPLGNARVAAALLPRLRELLALAPPALPAPNTAALKGATP